MEPGLLSLPQVRKTDPALCALPCSQANHLVSRLKEPIAGGLQSCVRINGISEVPDSQSRIPVRLRNPLSYPVHASTWPPVFKSRPSARPLKSIEHFWDWGSGLGVKSTFDSCIKISKVKRRLDPHILLDAAEVLRMYKRQSYLEKRMYTKKSILDVAPVFLKKKDGLKQYCYFIFLH